MSAASKPTVLMVLRQGRPISTYPTVVNAARMWVRAGYEVDIITQAESDVPDLFSHYIAFRTKSFPAQMVQLIVFVLTARPSVVIAYEPIDAELCALLPPLHCARYIYHNIELRYPGKRYHRLHQALERRYFSASDTVICQDSLRFGELKRLLGPLTPSTREYFVPNTYMQEPMPVERRYWHKRFELAEQSKILLYSGSIERKKLPEEVIAKLLEVMPEDWCLALWGWSIRGYAETLQEKYSSAILKRRLLLSLETLPENQYLEAVASSNAGLIWYGATIMEDANEHYIGLSSGKFWRFVTLNKPVLALNKPGLGEFIVKNDLGVTVQDIKQITTETLNTLLMVRGAQGDIFYDEFYCLAI